MIIGVLFYFAFLFMNKHKHKAYYYILLSFFCTGNKSHTSQWPTVTYSRCNGFLEYYDVLFGSPLGLPVCLKSSVAHGERRGLQTGLFPPKESYLLRRLYILNLTESALRYWKSLSLSIHFSSCMEPASLWGRSQKCVSLTYSAPVPSNSYPISLKQF